MRIITIVRTLNEEKNIVRFCQSYTWADKILIADGGSTDSTVLLAKTFPNVRIQPYFERIMLKNNTWRNPEGEHIQFLIDWALAEEKPDWILFDDCDCVPNFLLKEQARWLLEDCEFDTIYAVRIYLWGVEKHFPSLAQPAEEGVWETSLWGWKPESEMKFISNKITGVHEHYPRREVDKRMNLFPPYCLLHRPWIDEDAVERKRKFYNESGLVPDMRHPLDFGGKLEDLPDWAVE